MLEKSFGEFKVHGTALTWGPGVTYWATEPATGQQALIHTLAEEPDHPATRSEIREFYRRQRAASVLATHPRAWNLVDAGTVDGTHYFTVAGPPGQCLTDHVHPELAPAATIVRHGVTPVPGAYSTGIQGLSLWTIRNWLGDLSSAVDHAHQQGAVLGNISPQNVWIAVDGSAMLMDPGTGGEWRTKPGAGDFPDETNTLAYLAPEQVMGWPVGPHTDIYALGAILYWLLGGVFPLQRRNDAARIGRYLPLPPLPSQTDPALAAICKKATALSSSARFHSADLLRAALAQSAEDMIAARTRAARAARNTMVRSLPRKDAQPEQPRTGSATLLGRWLQQWR